MMTRLGVYLMEHHPGSPVPRRRMLSHWCPACNEGHSFMVGSGPGPSWGWNGSLTAPEFSPSMRRSITVPEDPIILPDGKTKMREQTECHYFLEVVPNSAPPVSQIRYLTDCIHALVGRTVPLPEYP